MTDPQTGAVLQDIVRRESRSLLSYVRNAYPWTTSAGDAALQRLNEAIRQGGEAVTELSAYLTRRRIGMPFLGSYPVNFTAYNFLAMSHLLPMLVRSERELVTALESDVSRLPAGDAKGKAEALLTVKRRTLEALQSLATP